MKINKIGALFEMFMVIMKKNYLVFVAQGLKIK